jgi:argininosuccinate lyase
VLYHSLAKWADDLIQWSTTEYNFVDIPDRYCNTSSIMMQKKNVIGPAEVKGASAEALGCFVVSYHALKGTTGLPVTERYYALEMLWKVADSAARDLGWFSDLRCSRSTRRTCASRRGATGRRRLTWLVRSCPSVALHGGQRIKSSAYS